MGVWLPVLLLRLGSVTGLLPPLAVIAIPLVLRRLGIPPLFPIFYSNRCPHQASVPSILPRFPSRGTLLLPMAVVLVYMQPRLQVFTSLCKTSLKAVSTVDTRLAIVALASCSTICSIITSKTRKGYMQPLYSGDQSPWLHQSRQRTLMPGRAEFVSRSPRVDSKQKMWNSPETTPTWTNSLVKGYYAKLGEGAIDHQDYYSTFHKTNLQNKFTEQEWEDFSQKSTRKAMVELAASSEFTDWMIEHADRIKLLPRDDSSDESVGSKSSSGDEDEESHSWFKLF